MDKISIQELTDIIAKQTGETKKFSEQFLRELVSVISEYLLRDGFVKVKGLGTFKIITVEERKSVDVNTGREIVLPAHSKVQFTPEDAVKQTINEPYSHLETTVLDNPMDDDSSHAKPAGKKQEKPKTEKPKTEEPEPVKPEPEEPKPSDPAPDERKEQKSADANTEEQEQSSFSGSIWWWIGAFVLIDVLLLLYFTIPNWKPALEEMFASDNNQEQVEEELTEEEQFAKDQAYADSLLAIADSMLVQYQDSVSDAIAEEYMADAAEPATTETTEPAASKPAASANFDMESYDYKMAMNAPVREVVTVIDGSRLTMVAYRAYGHKDFWVYVYDANRDVLRRPSGIAKGMSLKIADLPAELVDPNSEEALAKARELAKKYTN